jgi:hypothetical protein
MNDEALSQHMRMLFEVGFQAEFESIRNIIESKNNAAEALIAVRTAESMTAAKVLNDEALSLIFSLKSGKNNFDELMRSHFQE